MLSFAAAIVAVHQHNAGLRVLAALTFLIKGIGIPYATWHFLIERFALKRDVSLSTGLSSSLIFGAFFDRVRVPRRDRDRRNVSVHRRGGRVPRPRRGGADHDRLRLRTRAPTRRSKRTRAQAAQRMIALAIIVVVLPLVRALATVLTARALVAASPR